MKILQTFTLYASERLEYTVDYIAVPVLPDLPVLETGETIASSTWTLAGAATLTVGTGLFSPLFTDTTTTVWILADAAGVVGQVATVLNVITTSLGHIYARAIQIRVG